MGGLGVLGFGCFGLFRDAGRPTRQKAGQERPKEMLDTLNAFEEVPRVRIVPSCCMGLLNAFSGPLVRMTSSFQVTMRGNISMEIHTTGAFGHLQSNKDEPLANPLANILWLGIHNFMKTFLDKEQTFFKQNHQNVLPRLLSPQRKTAQTPDVRSWTGRAGPPTRGALPFRDTSGASRRLMTGLMPPIDLNDMYKTPGWR